MAFYAIPETDLQDAISQELGDFVKSSFANFTCGGSVPMDATEGKATSNSIALRWDSSDSTTGVAKLIFPPNDNNAESKASLDQLITACQPASFGYQGKNVLDESYRKATKMDRSVFSVDFCPYESGIVDTIAQLLLPNVSNRVGTKGVKAELYKLNIYDAPSGFFKAHVDTPRSDAQFGSLVVSLPCHHEGGELIVRHAEQSVTFDWSTSGSGEKAGTVQWAAFYSDCQHEIREVTEGHRITLTYNLYYAPGVGDLAGNSTVMDVRSLPLYRKILEALTEPRFMAHGKPMDDLNELSVHWIADETWTYRTFFVPPSDHGKRGVKTFLNCVGLDTFAAVYLNGKLILASENMFVAHRVDITNFLGSEDEQVLEIEFQPARKKGLELVREHNEHRFIVHQTKISRGPVRKAQYHWGWDWGPILMSCGPWKPIYVETYVARIEDVWIQYELSEDLKNAKGKVFVHHEGIGRVNVEIKMSEEVVTTLDGFEETGCEGVVSADFELFEPSLWWPRGYGLQSLYSIHATLHLKNSLLDSNDDVIDQAQKMTGFRRVNLIQEADSDGTSFYFRVNDIDMFCGGSCWIPADSFLSRLTPSDYRSWIERAADGNQAMVRVWGGGIYEADAFYDAADEFGVLIWQDFAFACANYPAYPSYLESVEKEARQNVRRLRDHPSLVIWAGNNEDYQIVERYSLTYDTDNKDPQSWLKTNFPARYLYEHLLPNIIAEESTGVPYHPSSPFGNGASTVLKVDATIGDIHQWNVWHGTMEPYQHLPDMGGRFVSEFGMEAYPHIETLERCITREQDRYPGSMAMDFRNKAIGHERRLVTYVAENFRVRYDLAGFTHLTQVMQADALTWAYMNWRRDWGSEGKRKCGGVLVWQLNDCWPTMSWAVVDYYGIPKPGYYAIKRALEPVVVSVRRKVSEWTVRKADYLWQRDTSHIDMRKIWQDVEFDCWVASSRTEKLQAEVTVRFVSVDNGEDILPHLKQEVSIVANGTTDVYIKRKVELPTAQDSNSPYVIANADPMVIHATLSIEGKAVASDISWPEPIKYLSFLDRGIEVHYSEDNSKIVVSAKRPVKGFVFDEKQGVTLSDNGMDLIPGEVKEVRVKGCEADELKWRFVEME